MYCRKCGNSIQDDSLFCEFCGERTSKNEIENDLIIEEEIIENVDEEYNQNNRQATIDSIKLELHPMKWYKFLIYFSLPVGLVYNGIQYYKNITESIDILNTSMTNDMLYIFLSITYTCITFTIGTIALFKLNNYKLTGIKLFFIFIIFSWLSSAVDFIFFIPSAIYYGVLNNAIAMNYINITSNIIIGMIYFILNYKYFKKRNYLFK